METQVIRSMGRVFLAGLILLCLLSGQAIAQLDSIAPPKHRISIEFGIHRSNLGGKEYIGTPTENCECYAYWRFTAYPTTGFQFNLLYDRSFAKSFLLRSGISIYSRPEHYKSTAEIITQIQNEFNILIIYPDPDVIKYKISPINLEIPISLGYKKNNFEAYMGVRIFLASYVTKSRNFINGEERIVSKFTFDKQYEEGNMYKPRIYTEARLYYLLRATALDVNVFIGLDSEGLNFWSYSYHLQTGINIPLWRRK